MNRCESEHLPHAFDLACTRASRSLTVSRHTLLDACTRASRSLTVSRHALLDLRLPLPSGVNVHLDLRIHLHPGSVGQWILKNHADARAAFASLDRGSSWPTTCYSQLTAHSSLLTTTFYFYRFLWAWLAVGDSQFQARSHLNTCMHACGRTCVD